MRWIMSGLVVIVAGIMLGWAVPAEAAPPAVIYACIVKHADLVRIVASTEPCRKSETRITWNVAGPPGPQGPPGSPAPALEGFAEGIKCGTCHDPDQDSVYHVLGRKYQWEQSKHAYGGDIVRAADELQVRAVESVDADEPIEMIE